MKRLSEKVNIHAYCNNCGTPILEGEKHHAITHSIEVANGDNIEVHRAETIAVFCFKCGVPSRYKARKRKAKEIQCSVIKY